jgi:hypothetical protein
LTLTRDRLLLLAAIFGAGMSLRSYELVQVAAFLAGAVGLLAVHERVRIEFGADLAALTSLVVLGGTSLFWAMTRDGSGVDAVAFGLVAVVLFLSERDRPPRLPRASAWCAAAALPVLLRYLLRPPLEAAAAAPASSNWLAPFFGSADGFLSLTPVAYVAVVGAILYVRRQPAWSVCAIAVLVFWIPANRVIAPLAIIDAPFAHGLTPALPMLAPGLAYLMSMAAARPLAAVVPLVAAALAWNYWLMVQYTVGTLPKDAPVSFARMVRGQADVHTRPPYHYPFAFPANAWFSWREGIPADRFELLAFVPRMATVDLAMDHTADRFLLEGWEDPARVDDRESVRWIRERRASLVLPLDLPDDRDVELQVTMRARLEAPAVLARLRLEINGVDVGTFVAPPAAPVDVRLRLAHVGAMWRTGYNRLTFVGDGTERVDPADQRAPGPLGSRSGGDRAWPVAIYRIRLAPI